MRWAIGIWLVGLSACAIAPGSATTFGADASASATAAGSSTATGEGSESTDDDRATGTSDGSATIADTSDTSDGDTSGAALTTGPPDADTSSGGGGSSGSDDAPVGDLPEPAGVCNGGAVSTHAEAAPAPELHIFGVYEPSGASITVTIDREDIAMVVVLSSYEPVSWTLELAAGVELQEVVLNGYEPQTVAGHGDATVTDHSGPAQAVFACGYEWPGDGDCNTAALATLAEAMTGATLASFAGCYSGSSFSLQ